MYAKKSFFRFSWKCEICFSTIASWCAQNIVCQFSAINYTTSSLLLIVLLGDCISFWVALWWMAVIFFTILSFLYTSCLEWVGLHACTRHEQLVYACRTFTVRSLRVQFRCWWWQQATCGQRMCNARDKWGLLTSLEPAKSYGYLRIPLSEVQLTAAYVVRSRKETVVCMSNTHRACLRKKVHSSQIVRCTCVS